MMRDQKTVLKTWTRTVTKMNESTFAVLYKASDVIQHQAQVLWLPIRRHPNFVGSERAQARGSEEEWCSYHLMGGGDGTFDTLYQFFLFQSLFRLALCSDSIS